MSGFFSWRDDSLTLHVKINSKSSIVKLEPGPDRLKIKKNTAPPVNGKANKHLLKYLLKIFAVPQTSISIDRGANQSLETLMIRQPARLHIEMMSDPDITICHRPNIITRVH
ncbi:MAG: DUF167 domain-containing protein [Pseudomonadales bacterium]|nr:YggU family protein [Gammaproteobacteria bacterium]MDP6025510.1 DUF167 domain-containing protein [Pseudomonadales bacterium]MDP6315132.1 DUF167 domain-containing protein [Pseudomonadales bacterium]MDP7316093.1 DUF167 domain-containing protein [Pseudomonadales bacterium]